MCNTMQLKVPIKTQPRHRGKHLDENGVLTHWDKSADFLGGNISMASYNENSTSKPDRPMP